MGRPLDVLLIEGSEDDAALVVRELTQGGFEPRWRRVDTAAAMAEALEDNRWQIVLSDYAMPGFGAPKALETLRTRYPEIPFIVITGTVGEEAAVEMMRAGAYDYFRKDSLGLLVPAVECALGAAKLRAESRRAEAALRASEKRYRDLVERAGVAIVLDDRDGSFTFFNQRFCDLFGHDASDINSVGISDIVHPDDRERVMSLHLRHLEGDTAVSSYEFRGLHKDGSELHLEVDVTPLVDGNRIVGTRSYIRDQSERHNLRRQLSQAQKLEGIGRLAGGVAHDFNNLLQAILGHVDLAHATLPSSSAANEHLVEVRTAAERAATLARQLLAFSRRQRISPQLLDINDLVTGMMKMLWRIIGEDVELDLNSAPGPLTVNADPGQLEQVLLNLVVNARDAMPSGGRISIATARTAASAEKKGFGEPGVCLTVSDTGCGMDEDTQSRLFEPFFTTKEPGTGTGLGLAMVYGILRQHGGSIEVESSPGQGSSLCVCLPFAEGEPEQPQVTPAIPPGGTEIILVAEDDRAVRGVLVAALEGAGYRVLAAENGVQALEMFSAAGDTIDLVILDVVMPKMGGPEAYKQMRTIRPDLVGLFSSGYGGESSVSDPTAVANVLRKPYSADDLLRTVRDLLDSGSG